MPKSAETVTLHPTSTAFIPGVPAVVCEVSPREAKRLLAYSPPAFTVDPPDVPAAPEPDAPATTPEG